MKKIIVIILWFILVSFNSNQQQNISVSSEGEKETHNDIIAKNIAIKMGGKTKHVFSDFCNKYSKVAILYHLECGVPTSVQLAQAIAESGGGKSDLAKVTNNLFGMKYYKEIFSGEYYLSSQNTKCRKYDNFEDSFKDHADFLHKYYDHAIGKDWEYWVSNCKGYGGLNYWQHIGIIIEEYKLWEYDEMVKNYNL